MTAHHYTIIADPNDKRAALIADVLENNYFTWHERVSDWPQLCQTLAERERRSGQTTNLLIVAEDIPGVDRHIPLSRLLQRLRSGEAGGTVGNLLVLVYNVYAKLPKNLNALLLESRGFEIARDDLVSQLNKIFDQRTSPLPTIIPGNTDGILDQRIASLDDNYDSERGKRILARLCRSLWPDVQTVTIQTLRQGWSGAQVFCAELQEPELTPSGSWLLKVTGPAGYQKLRNGIEGWHRVRDLNVSNTYDVHYPHLHVPPDIRATTPDCRQIVRAGNHYAAAFHYLNEVGHVVSLGDLYIDDVTYLGQLPGHFCKVPETAAEALLRHLFRHLRTVWYGSKKSSSRDCPLWTFETATSGVGSPPPYSLTPRQSRQILHFLDQHSRIGTNLFGEEWKTTTSIVEWIRPTKARSGPLIKPMTIPLSPVHGDLNVENIRLWIERGHFFLIDFDTFNGEGHLPHDFAHLEAEIKLCLMDRERDGHAFLDHSDSRLPQWQKLEDQLLRDLFTDEHANIDFDERIARSYRMIRSLRTEARDLLQQDSLSFAIQYGAALLYHTLRSITFESVSLSKRLLAVHSAGRLINSLQSPDS